MDFTPSRIFKLGEYRAFWRRQIVSTEPVNRPQAEAAVRQLYRALEKPEPELCLWFDSPREAAGAAHILLLEQDPEFFAGYWGNLVRKNRVEWERIRALIAAQTSLAEWEDLRRRFIPPPFGEGRCRVGFHFLTRTLRDIGPAPWLRFGKRYNHFMSAAEDRAICTKAGRLREIEQYEALRKLQQETDPLRWLQEDVDEVEWACFYSSPDSHPAYERQACLEGLVKWPDPELDTRRISFGQLARVEFLAKECGKSFPPGYVALLDVGREVGLWWALEKVAVLCDRPAQLLRDEAGRLHNSEGPALIYPNGWRVYSVNGKWVDPVAVLPPEQITLDLIEKNRPFRKLLVERYGKARFRAEMAGRGLVKPPSVLSARLPVDPSNRLKFFRDAAAGRLPYYERYAAGDRVGVWNDLGMLGARVRSAEHAADALAVAYATMDRAAHNVKALIERLKQLDYEFAFEAHEPPSSDSRKVWRKVDSKFGPIPLSLRAWWEVVGSVNFAGDHPLLSVRSGQRSPALGALLTDPLVVFTGEVTLSEHEEEMRRDGAPAECILAPDRYHKHDISGGADYAIALPSPGADELVLNDPNALMFVDYLRLSFGYGGFPGFCNDDSKIPVREMKMLTSGLLDI